MSHTKNAWITKALASAAATACGAACAANIETDNPDLKLRWDTTAKYSAAARLKSADPALVGAANANQDDGDRNFGRGLISNRFDLFSEFDAEYRNVGLRLSGAGWYDQVYNRSNDNPGAAGDAYPNHSGAGNEFTRTTRRLHGRDAEMLDAFVFGKADIGSTRLTVRLGQHAIQWGESLFFGSNAIAGTMAPVDVTKLISVPGTQFKEAIRPVPQISGQLQISPSFSIGAFYQFRFEPNRLPAVGSYFSQSDTTVDGAERLLMGPTSAPRNPDQDAKNSGQGGLQMKFRAAETDFGLYAVRFHDKTFQFVSNIGATGLSSYYLAYHEDINAFGASASRTFGSANIAVEASIHTNQDLASTGVDLSALLGTTPTDNQKNTGYAVGRTAHVNVSMLWTPDPTPLFNEALVVAELAWNRVLSCTRNCDALDPQGSRDAVAFRMTMEPTYRQVISGLDLGVPIGFGYAPKGSRSGAIGPGIFPPENGGDVSIGLNGTYLDVWRITLGYTHYFGTAKGFINSTNTYSYGQSLKDRDFLAFSVRRTF